MFWLYVSELSVSFVGKDLLHAFSHETAADSWNFRRVS